MIYVPQQITTVLNELRRARTNADFGEIFQQAIDRIPEMVPLDAFASNCFAFGEHLLVRMLPQYNEFELNSLLRVAPLKYQCAAQVVDYLICGSTSVLVTCYPGSRVADFIFPGAVEILQVRTLDARSVAGRSLRDGLGPQTAHSVGGKVYYSTSLNFQLGPLSQRPSAESIAVENRAALAEPRRQ